MIIHAMPRPALPPRAVRALFLRRQHLLERPAAVLTAGRLGRFVGDAVNVLDRAHYLMVWSRFGPYDRTGLGRLM